MDWDIIKLFKGLMSFFLNYLCVVLDEFFKIIFNYLFVFGSDLKLFKIRLYDDMYVDIKFVKNLMLKVWWFIDIYGKVFRI